MIPWIFLYLRRIIKRILPPTRFTSSVLTNGFNLIDDTGTHRRISLNLRYFPHWSFFGTKYYRILWEDTCGIEGLLPESKPIIFLTTQRIGMLSTKDVILPIVLLKDNK